MPAESTGRAYAAAYTVIAAILGLAFLGFVVDQVSESGPWGTIIGALIGTFVGLYELAKIVWASKR